MADNAAYIAAVLSAILVHEAGHIIALALFGVKPERGKPGFWGIGIGADFTALSYPAQAAVSAAGSAVNFLCLCVFAPNTEFGAASLAYGAFNLLPLGMLDGGEILKSVLLAAGVADSAVYRILSVSGKVCTAALWMLAVYLSLRGNTAILLISVIYMVFMCFFRKSY